MSAEKVLVLGSNSFSGSHFAAHCLEQGLEVIGVSRGPELDECFLPYRWKGSPARFRFVQLDLNSQLDRVLELARENQPTYVVNFSAQGMVAQSWENPCQWYQTNTVAMAGLHHGLRGQPWLRKFVQASTPEVYGSTSGCIQEDAPLNPTTPYAISKAACDLNLLAYVKAYEFPAVLTRAANVCGPGQQLYRILPKVVDSVATGEKMRLDGGGLSQRSFIHIEDVCRATLAAAREGRPGDIFHLSTDRWVTIRELVEKICLQLKADLHEVVEVGPPRLGQDAAYLLDSTKARQQLGWSPERSLEEMIQATADWYDRYRASLAHQTRQYVHKA